MTLKMVSFIECLTVSAEDFVEIRHMMCKQDLRFLYTDIV
jgi:hypothetical protein